MKNKVTIAELIKARKRSKKEIDAAIKAVNKKFDPIVNAFIEHNSPVKVGDVYELAGKGGYKPRGCDRFVVYELRPYFFENRVAILAAGYWLKKGTGETVKWHVIPVFGNAMSPSELVLSKDQVYMS